MVEEVEKKEKEGGRLLSTSSIQIFVWWNFDTWKLFVAFSFALEKR